MTDNKTSVLELPLPSEGGDLDVDVLRIIRAFKALDVFAGETNTILAQKANATEVATQLAALVDSSPEALNTLNELAAALGDDPNFAATTIAAIAAAKAAAEKVMTGATADSDGASGRVPQPVAGDENKVLHGDSTYKYPSAIPIGLVACVATATIPAGWLRYGTGTTLTGCNVAFPDFYDHIVAGGNTCTLSAYETMLGLTGQCGGFGLDEESGTVRMPTVKFVQNALGDEVLGTVNEAGVPNIEGAWEGNRVGTSLDTTGFTGALYSKGFAGINKLGATVEMGTQGVHVGFDASLFNNLYGSSETVQPDSVLHYYIIHVYNAAVSASVAEVAEFVELLDGKADTSLNNVSDEGKANAVSWGMPDYTAPVIITGSLPFTAPSDGVVRVDTLAPGQNGIYYHTQINGQDFFVSSAIGMYSSGMRPISKNEVMTLNISNASAGNVAIYFYPCKGV